MNVDWIKTIDKLPEQNQEVLWCNIYRKKYFISKGSFRGIKFFTDEGEWIFSKDVLYWMSLPEPPKEQND